MRHEIVSLTGDVAWGSRNEVGEIYRLAFGCTTEQAANFVDRSFRHVRDYPGGTLLMAMHGDHPIGMLYGYTWHPDQWWSQRVGAPIIRAGYQHYLDSAFSLAELAVLPNQQGKGTGSALLSYQLANQPEDYVLLSTDADPSNRAANLYKRHGFKVMVSLFRYSESGPAAHIMGAPAKADSTKR